MSDKDRVDAEAAATRAASAEDGRINGIPRTDTPKRRFWQIHLSTAIFATIVVGAALREPLQDFRDYQKATYHLQEDEAFASFIIGLLIKIPATMVCIVAFEWLIRRRERGRLRAETKDVVGGALND